MVAGQPAQPLQNGTNASPPPYSARAAQSFVPAAGPAKSVASAAAFLLAVSFPVNYDFWWHLAAGRFQWIEHRLPVPDVFSYTAAGRSWVSHSWLPDALTYALYRFAGFAGPAWLFALAFAACIWLATATQLQRGARPFTALLLSLLLTTAMVPYIGPRPQVMGFALFGAMVWVVERWVTRRDSRIWALPALFALWANVHGSFAVGLGWLAVWGCSDWLAWRLHWPLAARLDGWARRRLAVTWLCSLAAIALNPHGPALLLYPLTKLHNPWLKSLVEWNSLDVSLAPFWPFVLLLGIVAACLVLRRPALHPADLAVTGLFVLAALYGRRFVPFAGLSLVWLLAAVLAQPNNCRLPAPPWWRRLTQRRAAWGARLASARPGRARLLGGVVIVAALALGLASPPYDPQTDRRLPSAAVAALTAEQLPQPLLNHYNWGGYLIWQRWPQLQVYIDGRGDDLYMRGGEFQDQVILDEVRLGIDEVLERRGFRSVLYPKDRPLVRYLLATGRWQARYEDDLAVLLVRKD